MGEHSLGCVLTSIGGGVPPPIGGVNNSLGVARRPQYWSSKSYPLKIPQRKLAYASENNEKRKW